MRRTKDHMVADLLRLIDQDIERLNSHFAKIKDSGHPNAEQIIDTLCDHELIAEPRALELARSLLAPEALVEPSRFEEENESL